MSSHAIRHVHIVRLGTGMRGGFGDRAVDWCHAGIRARHPGPVLHHLARRLQRPLPPGPVVLVAPGCSTRVLDWHAHLTYAEHVDGRRRVGLVVYGGSDRGLVAASQLRVALASAGMDVVPTTLGFNTALYLDTTFTPFDDLARSTLLDDLLARPEGS